MKPWRNIRRWALGAMALAASGLIPAVLATPAAARTNVNINVDLATLGSFFGLNAYREPRLVAIPGCDAYYAPDYQGGDLYLSGSAWFLFRDGGWFQARSYRGPWRGVSNVPPYLFYAPRGYYRFERPGRRDDGWYRGRYDRDRNGGWERARAAGRRWRLPA